MLAREKNSLGAAGRAATVLVAWLLRLVVAAVLLVANVISFGATVG